MKMRRKAIGLQSASPPQYYGGQPIATRFALCALTEAQSEKLPWVEAIVAELIPAKANPTKSVVLSQGTDDTGVTRPSQSQLVGNADIRALSATIATTAGSNPNWWGPGLILRKGMRGKRVREASRLSARRYTKPLRGSGLDGFSARQKFTRFA